MLIIFFILLKAEKRREKGVITEEDGPQLQVPLEGHCTSDAAVTPPASFLQPRQPGGLFCSICLSRHKKGTKVDKVMLLDLVLGPHNAYKNPFKRNEMPSVLIETT